MVLSEYVNDLVHTVHTVDNERSPFDEIFGNSGKNSNGTVHPAGVFSEKRWYLSRHFLFLAFYWNSRKFLYHFSTLTSARLFTGKLPREIGKNGGKFPKISNVSLSRSVVLADVLEHSCNLSGENELSFVVGTCVFFYLHNSGFQSASEFHRGKTLWKIKAGFPKEMWMLQQPNRWNCRLLLQKK